MSGDVVGHIPVQAPEGLPEEEQRLAVGGLRLSAAVLRYIHDETGLTLERLRAVQEKILREGYDDDIHLVGLDEALQVYAESNPRI